MGNSRHATSETHVLTTTPILKPCWEKIVSNLDYRIWEAANIENPYKSGQPVFNPGRRFDISYVGLRPVEGSVDFAEPVHYVWSGKSSGLGNIICQTRVPS
jgi:hypothetical protein